MPDKYGRLTKREQTQMRELQWQAPLERTTNMEASDAGQEAVDRAAEMGREPDSADIAEAEKALGHPLDVNEATADDMGKLRAAGNDGCQRVAAAIERAQEEPSNETDEVF